MNSRPDGWGSGKARCIRCGQQALFRFTTARPQIVNYGVGDDETLYEDKVYCEGHWVEMIGTFLRNTQYVITRKSEESSA